MISITEIAEVIENGLNAILDNSEIQFHIWATAGEYQKALRNGNVVPYTVHGNLRVSTSAHEANILSMGTNGLSLDFLLPVQPPKTNAAQTEEQLLTVRNAQYPFPELMLNVINEYFREPRTFSLDGDKYSVSFVAGVSTTGAVDMHPEIGRAIQVSVYINLYYIEGGTMSKDVKITFDGEQVPFQSVRTGRSSVVDRDIDIRDLVSKGTASSSAFSIHLQFPSNNGVISRALTDFMLNGIPNVAHFVGVKWGDLGEKLYLMTFDKMDASAEGISIAGDSVDLIEILDNCEIINVPDSFQIGRFVFDNSSATELTFTLPACKAYVAGRAFEANGQLTLDLEPNDFECDEDEGKYYVYLITDRAVSVMGGAFEVVKEASGG